MSKSTGGNKLSDDKKSADLKNEMTPNNLLMIEKIKEISMLPYITDDEVYKQLKSIYDKYPHVSKKALDSNNQTPLIHAAILGMPSVIRALYKLTKGNPLKDPEINSLDNQDKTALMYAISYKDDGEKTADPNILKRRATIDLLINVAKIDCFMRGELNAKGEIKINEINQEFQYNPNAHLALACFHGNLYSIKNFLHNKRYGSFLKLEDIATYIGISIIKNKEIAKYFVDSLKQSFPTTNDLNSNFFQRYSINLLQYISNWKSEQGFQNLLELGMPIRLIKFALNKFAGDEASSSFLENQISKSESVNSTVDHKENIPPPAFNPAIVTPTANPINVVENASAPAFEPPPYSDIEGLVAPAPTAAPIRQPTPMDLAGKRKEEASLQPVIRTVPDQQRKEDNKVNLSKQRSSLYAPPSPQSGSSSGIPKKQPLVRNNYSEKLKNLLTMLEAAEKDGDPELLSGTLQLIGPRIENIGTNMKKSASVGLDKDDLKIERPPSPA